MHFLPTGSYSTADNCRKLMPRESEIYQQLGEEALRRNSNPFSPVMPIIKILNNLDSKVNLR